MEGKPQQEQQPSSPAPAVGKELVLRDLLIGPSQIAKVQVPSAGDLAKLQQQKATVLEEDEYVQHLEEIIKRDFFPDLARLEAYKEYLARKEAGEKDLRIPTILIKQTPVDSFKRSRDPTLAQNRPEGPTDSPQSRPKVDVSSMGLDEYLQRYTSEDNKSFADLFARQKDAERRKHAWMHRQAELANTELKALEAANNGAVKSIEFMTPDPQLSKSEARSSMFFTPEGMQVAAVPLSASEDLVGAEKEIKRQNTRLPSTFVLSQLHLESTQTSRIRVEAIKERMQRGGDQTRQPYGEIGGLRTPDLLGVRAKDDDSYFSLDKLTDLKANRRRQNQQQHQDPPAQPEETPVIRGYRLVKPKAYDVLEIIDSPIMTWGEVADEPRMLEPIVFSTSGGDPKQESTDNSRFKIPEISERDQLSHDLVGKIKKKQLDTKRAEIERYFCAAKISYARKKNNASASGTYMKYAELSRSGQRLLMRTGSHKGTIFSDLRQETLSSHGGATRGLTPKIQIAKSVAGSAGSNKP